MQELNEELANENKSERLDEQMQVRFDRDELDSFYSQFEPFDLTEFVLDQLEDID